MFVEVKNSDCSKYFYTQNAHEMLIDMGVNEEEMSESAVKGFFENLWKEPVTVVMGG